MRRYIPSDQTKNSTVRSGFSLVELTVTLLILGVLAAVSVPRMSRVISDYRADAAAARIVADLKFAGRHARTRGRSETVTFDSGTSQYSCSTISHPNSPSSVYSVNLSDYPYQGSIGRVSFEGRSSVTFDGFGFPDADGKITVSSGNAVRTIKLSRATGIVTVGRGQT